MGKFMQSLAWTEERFHSAVTFRRSAVSVGPLRPDRISGSCLGVEVGLGLALRCRVGVGVRARVRVQGQGLGSVSSLAPAREQCVLLLLLLVLLRERGVGAIPVKGRQQLVLRELRVHAPHVLGDGRSLLGLGERT